MEPFERLKSARIAAGFKTAISAAESLGVNPRTYTAHENGNRSFGREQAAHYARRFKTTPEFLLFGKEQPPISNGSNTDGETVLNGEVLNSILNNPLTHEPGTLDAELFSEALKQALKLESEILGGNGTLEDVSMITAALYKAAKAKKGK